MTALSPAIAIVLLLRFAVRLTLFGSPRSAPEKDGSPIHRLEHGVAFYGVVICAIKVFRSLRDAGSANATLSATGCCHKFCSKLRP
jgi:hypothetical protein